MTRAPIEVLSKSAWGGIEHAEAIRSAVLTIWLIIVVGTPYSRYPAFPVEALNLHGLGQELMASSTRAAFLWSVPTLIVLKTVTALSCLAALVLPRASRVAIPLSFLGVLVLDQLTKALGGFSNHAQIAPLLVLGIVAVFSDAGYRRPLLLRGSKEHSLPSSNERHAAVVWLSSAALVIPYTYIGTNRLIAGGFDMFTGDALVGYLASASRGFSSYVVPVDLYPFRHLLNAGFGLMTLLEISSIGLLVFDRFRMVWLAAITCFHLTILALMNIAFWENVVLLWVIFWWGWRRVRFS